MSKPLPPHGGDVSAAAKRWGIPASEWLDLSTGIAPWPYPFGALPIEAFARLPQAAERDRLVEAAAEAYGVRDRTAIRPVAGAQQAISLLPVLLPGRRVAVLGPTYSEHGSAWAQTAAAVTETATLDTIAETVASGGIGVIANPNNPDGRIVAASDLLRIADLGEDGLLVVDEAFADMRPEVSIASEIGRPGLIVLRSFGKFFGLAGVRLGFCLGPPRLLARLDQLLGPWPVAGPALTIGAAALRDTAWQAAQRQRSHAASKRLNRMLVQRSLELIGNASLFVTARIEAARCVHDRLCAAGILVRAFDAMPDMLRFGLPPDAAAEARLDQALSSIVGG